jgi:hypothetical protein
LCNCRVGSVTGDKEEGRQRFFVTVSGDVGGERAQKRGVRVFFLQRRRRSTLSIMLCSLLKMQYHLQNNNNKSFREGARAKRWVATETN